MAHMPEDELAFHGHPRNIQYTTKVARLLNQSESGLARALADESENFLERQYGRLLVALEVDFTSDSYDVSEVLLETLEREFYGDLNRSVPEAFEHALTATNQALADLAAEGQNDWVGKLNAVACVLHNNQLAISQCGEAHGYLVRGPSVTKITEGLGETTTASAKTFSNTAVGDLEIGDKLLLATKELYNHLSLSDVRRHLYLHPPQRSIRKIADQITVKPLERQLAAVVAELTTIDLVSAETVSEDPDEIVLGAPRRHFETLQRFKPLRSDSPVAEATQKARKYWDRRVAPTLSRRIAGAKRQVQTWQAKRRGQAPPPPPHAAAGTPETTRPPRADRPAVADRLRPHAQRARAGAVGGWQRLRPILQKAWAPIGRLLAKAWRRSGIAGSPAGRRLSRMGASVATQWQRLPVPKFLSSNRSAIYRNLIVAVGVILVISLVMSINGARTKEKQTDIRKRIQAVEAQQAQAEASFIFKDLEGARKQLADAKRGSDELGKEKLLKSDIAALQQRVQESFIRINNIVPIPDQAVADFGSFNPPGTLTDLAQTGPNLYAMPESGPLYAFNQGTKETKVANDNTGLNGKVRSTTTATNGDVLVLTDKPTVYQLDLATSQIAEQSVGTGGNWESGVAIDTVQQNAFILDADGGQIWRHARTLAAFNKGEPYLTAPTDLKTAVDFATGAKVFVLKSDGAVVSFAGGNAQPEFSLKGVPAPQDALAGANALAVNFSTENLYVADPKQQRVVEFNGAGTYTRQFQNRAFENVRDILIDDKTNTLFILADNKVFQIPLSG